MDWQSSPPSPLPPVSPPVVVPDCEKKAADLGFDLTKQFLTMALAAIAFVVGTSLSQPGAVSTAMLWMVVLTFGLSAILGLLFLMHGVNILSIQKSFDIYATSLRWLSAMQILLLLVGAILLVPSLHFGPNSKPASSSLEIRVDQQRAVIYPIDPNKNMTIEVENGKVKVTATK